MLKLLKTLSVFFLLSFNSLIADTFTFEVPQEQTPATVQQAQATPLPVAPATPQAVSQPVAQPRVEKRRVPLQRQAPALPLQKEEIATKITNKSKINIEHDVKKVEGKEGYAHIHIVLDGSGSMSGLEPFIKGAFDTFVKQQKKLKNDVTFSVWVFSNNQIKKIANCTRTPSLKGYSCVGGTPWSEATVIAIEDLDDRIDKLTKTGKNPESIIFAWITDGIAPVSAKARRLIFNHSEEWNFMLLGIGEHSGDFGVDGIGLPKANCFNVLLNNPKEVSLVWQALGEFCRRSRGL